MTGQALGAIPVKRLQRECGECTGCCDGWVKMNVYGHEVRPGQPCPFSTGHNCSIYEQRPVDPCQNFICGWLRADSFLPEWMRPDKAGCIVLPAELFWRGLPVDIAIPVGQRITPQSLAWLKHYVERHARLLIFGEGNEIWSAYGPPDFQHEMAHRLQRGEQLW